VLDDAQCQAVWKKASPNEATISQDQAAPYIVNFSMVDGDGDGKIAADEFKAGCAEGMVKSTTKTPPGPRASLWISTGFLYQPNNNVQIDVGSNFGAPHASRLASTHSAARGRKSPTSDCGSRGR